MTVPMNIFLFQEIQRFQNVIAKVRFTLTQLQLAIKGEVVMSSELQETLQSIFDASVPWHWENTLTGDEFSWRLPSLGLWFTSLLNRDEQYRKWLNSGRPNSFWFSGFFNPAGLLTAMKQEVTRKHKSEKWALDDVVLKSEVTNFESKSQVKNQPDEGIYVHGLSLEGAAWSRAEATLAESEPKILYTDLPVLYITAARKTKVDPRIYDCPIYKYSDRGDKYLLAYASLTCPSDKPPSHWVIRGTALLCNR
jgi:dynein heavy chain